MEHDTTWPDPSTYPRRKVSHVASRARAHTSRIGPPFMTSCANEREALSIPQDPARLDPTLPVAHVYCGRITRTGRIWSSES